MVTDKYLREIYFWLMDSEVSVCGEVEIHGSRNVWQRRLLTSWWPGSRREGAREEVGERQASKNKVPSRTHS